MVSDAHPSCTLLWQPRWHGGGGARAARARVQRSPARSRAGLDLGPRGSRVSPAQLQATPVTRVLAWPTPGLLPLPSGSCSWPGVSLCSPPSSAHSFFDWSWAVILGLGQQEQSSVLGRIAADGERGHHDLWGAGLPARLPWQRGEKGVQRPFLLRTPPVPSQPCPSPFC